MKIINDSDAVFAFKIEDCTIGLISQTIINEISTPKI